ncbi:DUF294 nucleotidyltransferase-like domain-containing protein [Saccharospirillum salsuginis]|uniref:Cyclic nucleotide-binding protein n=1 Tax=Saccharospirillum salsuginis TaxID=418750 RepID=A0A918KE33_9GAMM|nr:DUF294 nucleotidyltransferase-like domain-containing protein [Saccharospirillum salsuginis]GGX59727.1 cyclic nucleotide-binding protein [Saccharospirillum salsuginis]
MEVEHLEIREHMRRFPPFDGLSEERLNDIASQVEVGYFKAGSVILEFGQDIKDLYYIRSGAVEIYRRNGELYNRLSEGEIFGQLGLLMSRKARFPAKALEDTLIYFINQELFDVLWENEDEFADFVEIEDQYGLRKAITQRQSENDLLSSRVRKLITREPVALPSKTSLQDVARHMTDEGVSSLIITEDQVGEGGEAHPRMVGIITDRDLRTRALAEGLAYDTPIADIMSSDLITVGADDFVFEAMLMMLRYNIHHLPVLHRDRPIGVIALSDIIRYESQSSIYLVNDIHHKQNQAELGALTPDIRATFVRMVNEDANSHMIGSAIAGIGRSITQRLLELAEAELGPPPVPYCFLALGSMARDEQFVVTDQDNALVLDDAFDPEQHDDYFMKLATYVSDGLAACGYDYCKGGIMGTNPTWRQPLQVWKQYFTDWIEKPDPQALLNSSIFFDLDGIYGETDFAEILKDLVARRARRSQMFLACLARNALNRTPPLGFFRTFVMENDGKHNNSINLKRRGTAPLADVIRVHALACGSTAQNSFDRLDAIADARVLGHTNGDELRDALEFMAIVRARHQALDIEAGRDPDNNVEPEHLSSLERRTLKDAFQILSNAQKFLKMRYQVNRV